MGGSRFTFCVCLNLHNAYCVLSNKGSDNETMFRKEKILGGLEFAVTNTRLHPGPEKLQGKVIYSQTPER